MTRHGIGHCKWFRSGILFAVAILGTALPSYGGFRLRIEDVGAGVGAVITDQGAGDGSSTPGIISFSGTIGAFTINFTTGASQPPIVLGPGYAALDINSFNVSSSSGGTLRITLENTDYSVGPDGPLGLLATIGGTIDNGTITAQSWVNPLNAVPALGADQGVGAIGAIGGTPAGSIAAFSPAFSFSSSGSGAFSGTSGVGFTKSGSYSLFSQTTLTFSGSGSASFDEKQTVIPEPTTWTMLGTGLLAIARKLRRRRLPA